MITSLDQMQNFWYVAALSDDLGTKKPLARTIADQPVVLFRDSEGKAHALFDRCCHRQLPLSLGTLTKAGLQCGYHGWEYAPGGACVRIPGQAQGAEKPRGRVSTFPLAEEDGLIWVYTTPDVLPPTRPFPITGANDKAYASIRIDFGSMEAPVENAVDNFMDSLHPPFVHAGLIYDDRKRNPVEIAVHPYHHPGGHWGIEGAYLGEPVPTEGWIGRLFAERSTDPVFHEERFVAPTISQTEYRIGTTTHLSSSHLFTPETPTRTRMYLLLRTKSRVPRFITQPILRRLFTRLFRQDIDILQKQYKALENHQPLPRVSTELDIFSMMSIQFMHQLAEGHPPDNIPVKPQVYKVMI